MPRGHRPHLKTKPHVSREDGFILVAVLLLIALATVLIVTTSGVARIESKAVANSMREEQARQNALFGLEVALAQLQREAGPDQRVTATAEILNTNSAVPSPVNNPFWTGVWKTYNPDWEKDPARFPWSRVQPHDITMQGQVTQPLRPWSTNPSNVSWLVSMPPGLDALDPVGWNNWTPSNAILLASNWGTNSQANTVYAPLVMVTNVVKAGTASMTNLGSYAYWVSDEGVKAKISLCDTNATTMAASSPGMLVSKLLHFTAPAAPSVAQLLTNYGITGVPDLRGNTNMAKLTTMNGLQFVTNGIPAFSNNLLSADLTVHGYGVACDVRRGGLKQDLTAAFESTQANPDGFKALLFRSGPQDFSIGSGGIPNSDDALMAWRSATMSLPVNLALTTAITNPIGGSQIDGMRWESLYNFYTLYKARWEPSPYVVNAPPASSPRGIGTPLVNGFDSIDSRFPIWRDPAGGDNTYIWSGAMTPAVIANSLVVQLGAVNIGGLFCLQAQYYPLLVLYNPYSVALNVGSSSFTVSKNMATALRFSNLRCGNTSINNTNIWPMDSQATPAMSIIAMPNPAANNPRTISFAVTNQPNNVMAPGEIRAYGLLGANSNRVSDDVDGGGWFSSVAIAPDTDGRPLRSSANLTIGDGFGGISITLTNPWTTNSTKAFGTNDGNATISAAYNTPPGISYNSFSYTPTGRWNSGTITINNWPAARSSLNNAPAWLPGYNSSDQYITNGLLNGRTISSLVNSPVTIASITERFKGTIPGTTYTKYLNGGVTNCFPIFMGNSVFFNAHRSGVSASVGGALMYGTETSVFITNEPSVQIVPNAVVSDASTLSWGSQPVGDAIPQSGKNPRNNVVKVLRGVPFAPLTSLGQFMHHEEYYDAGQNNNNNLLFPRTIPSLSIGGSFCSPETGPYFTSIHFNGNPGSTNMQWNLYADNSFLANEALFDTYFFSTAPPTNGFSWGSGLQGYGPYGMNLTVNSIANREPLPNPRHVYYSKNGSNPVVADLQDEGKAAANLLIDGAFNVNSTSVVAWKALISSLNGSSMTVKNAVTGNTENRINLTNPISRFWDVCGAGVNIPWDGTRCLTDLQVDALAREIVRQVKARGPFLSMGDFLNRRLAQEGTVWDTNHLMGALQEAIENTQTNGIASDVNDIVHDPNVSCPTTPLVRLAWNSVSSTPMTNNSGFYTSTQPFISQIATNTAVGIPGYLMQQDLVQAFAPVMTVRSDTFLIRFYGDSRGVLSKGRKTPEPESRVWGEAVVQRLPEYYDQEDPILSSTSVIPGITRPLGDATPFLTKNGEILSQLNRTFGRRFKVVSLRWLTPEEIVPATSGS